MVPRPFSTSSSSLGWKLDNAELQEAYSTLDQDKNGLVDFREFVDCELAYS